MTWDVSERGFLPIEDPKDYDHPSIRSLKLLTANLPIFMERHSWREECIYRLRTDVSFDGVMNSGNNDLIELYMRYYSYIASAYVHSDGDVTSKRLPMEIAEPLTALASRLRRQPILSYASYCLYNWERINKEKPVELGNIRLLNNFALTHKSHEDWFVLIHVDIEAKAARAIVKIWEFLQVIQKDTIGVLQCLASIFSSLTEMNRTFKRMPEACHPDVYYNKVRPYIFGFNEVVYEGAEPKTLTLRGETGAQSSILPAFDAFLGIKHTNSILTKHLEEMLQYMPYEHVEFINSIKNSKIDFRDMCAKKPETRDLYNACIEKIIEFRAQHLEYAVEYIQKRVENPTGTGGTPFIPWLDQLRSETEKFFIKGNGHG